MPEASSTATNIRKLASKACDRCRKRKARCNEGMPCGNCLQAGVSCELTTPTLKRGPRKSGPSNLDQRLRNLETLLSGTAATNSTINQEMLPANPQTSYADAELGLREDVLSTTFSLPISSDNHDRQWASSSSYSFVNTNTQPIQANPPPPSALSPKDLRYRDVNGQLRWLGPSSGMPLLDSLKPDSTSSLSAPIALSDWITASTTIAAGGRNPVTTAATTSLNSNNDGEVLRTKLLAICSEDLIDVLIEGYFAVTFLSWPILHPLHFSHQYRSDASKSEPTFVAMLISMCCIAAKSSLDARLEAMDASGWTTLRRLATLAEETILPIALQHADLEVVQALLHMSVFEDGTENSLLFWSYLGQAVTTSMEIGLHRRVDDWDEFDSVLVEVRKRTLWVVYAHQIKACSTSGRPLLLRFQDIVIEDPYPPNPFGIRQSDLVWIVAGTTAYLRIHVILETIIARINAVSRRNLESSSHLAKLAQPTAAANPVNELSLLLQATEGLPGDWSFSSETIADPNNARFYAKTRVFGLQHFARLLITRHELSVLLNRPSQAGEVELAVRQITESALAIVGAYFMVSGRGRLRYFGAHAISQLSQAGAGLITVILHARNNSSAPMDDLSYQASQGLDMALHVLDELGKRRTSGLRSAELLASFSRTCRIPIFYGVRARNDGTSTASVDVPMLRSLRRRIVHSEPILDEPPLDFAEWLNFSMESFAGWEGIIGANNPQP